MASTELDEQIVVRVPADLRRKVQAKAEAEDRTEAWVVRRALYLYVDGRKK